ncbi:F-box/LRR-repeat protein 2 [Notothenia coriiceps]|uniref:F-box/LRR-repeat protein 2 n=1 Tax=Notothenia coriiceps TaxID=8208 RepID=A0A6I9PVY0_9TELE|nr:PREDICTED: F-box/LRR-repeat protein 20-like [Notothenia coriiceps]
MLTRNHGRWVTVLARNCHELEKMDLEECILVTDNTLVQLSIHCPRLQALSLSHCELITDDGIRALSSSTCGQERLTVVELDNCPLITDVTLEHLKSCHRLERIELYDCQQVTRAGIKRIRAHLPEIKVHAYFAPVTPPPSVHGGGQRLCRCCIIL